MNIATITIALLGLSTIAAICAAWHEGCRADNLEIVNHDLRAALDEACAALDDGQRALTHLRHLHDSLLAENNTLLIDLMQSETRSSYLESLHRQRKGETAGVLLTHLTTLVNPKRKLTVHTENVP